MRRLIKTLFLFSLCFVVSCGKSSNNDRSTSPSDVTQNETIRADGSNVTGIYATPLVPLNKNIHMKRLGTAALQRDGDTFSAFVKIKSGQRGTKFKQAIYTGRRCPTIKDDLNKDAYVDIQEAMIAIGKIVIPLDSDLDSQMGGIDNYPITDATAGAYFYKTTASFARMFADLKTPDQNETDNIIKLGPDDGLTFPGRIIFIQGINEKVFVPPTVATLPGEDVHKSLPVACGVLWKVDTMPADLLVPQHIL